MGIKFQVDIEGIYIELYSSLRTDVNWRIVPNKASPCLRVSIFELSQEIFSRNFNFKEAPRSQFAKANLSAKPLTYKTNL